MATIADVAKLAEVSKGTVSNVFSKKRPISKEVTKRVLAAAKQLNYVPNHVARSLAIKKTMIVALKMPLSQETPMTGFEMQLMNGVIRECSRHGYRVLLDTVAQQEDDVTLYSTDPVDGVILLNPHEDDPRIETCRLRDLPFVVIGRPSPAQDEVSYVDNNNVEMVREVGRYLLMSGHRSILFLNAAQHMTVTEDRTRGLEMAYEEWGLPAADHMVQHYRNKRQSGSDYGYYSILNSCKQSRFTAVIADTDRVALGAIRAARELGLHIPEALSVIALSNDNTLAQESVPRLTSVEQSADKLGAEAAKILMARMNGVTSPQKMIIDAKLVLRDSCANLN